MRNHNLFSYYTGQKIDIGQHILLLKIAETECFIRKKAAKSSFLGHEYSKHYTVQKNNNITIGDISGLKERWF